MGFLEGVVVTPSILTTTNNYGAVKAGGGGYVIGAVSHPAEANLIYLRTDLGGAYRRDEVNNKFVSITDKFKYYEYDYQGVDSLAIDPRNVNAIYMAVGTSYNGDIYSTINGAIFKSNNKGDSFTKLGLSCYIGSNNSSTKHSGCRLAVDPTNENVILYGSARNGLFRTTNGGALASDWIKNTSLPQPTEDPGFTAVKFDPKVSGLIYAGIYSSITQAGLYKSIDRGLTWNLVTGTSGVRVSNIVVGNDGTSTVAGTVYIAHSAGLGKFKNNTYTSITSSTISGGNYGYLGLDVNPFNADEVITAPCYVFGSSIYRSTNGGTSWTNILHSRTETIPWRIANAPHRDYYAGLIYDQNNGAAGKVAWVTDFYGAYKCNDITITTPNFAAKVEGIETLVARELKCPPSGSRLLVGCLDFGGFTYPTDINTYPTKCYNDDSTVTNGSHPQDVLGLDYCETSPSRIVRTGFNRDGNNGNKATVSLSSNGGLNWTNCVVPDIGTGLYTKVAISASNPDVFLIVRNNGAPKFTVNNGSTWNECIGDIPSADGLSGVYSYFPQTLSADRIDGTKFYYATNDKFWRIIWNGSTSSPTFTSTLVNPTLTSYLVSIKAPPGASSEVWYNTDNGVNVSPAVQGYGSGKLFKSVNSGTNFTQLTNVDRAQLFGFGKKEPNSSTPYTIYVMGKVSIGGVLSEGIFSSIDGGNNWVKRSDSTYEFGNFVTCLEGDRQTYGTFYIATNGRYVRYGEFVGSVSETASITIPISQQVFGTGISINISVTASENNSSPITLVEFFEGNIKIGSSNIKVNGTYNFTWSSTVVGTKSLSAKVSYTNGLLVTTSAVQISIQAPAANNSISLNYSGSNFTVGNAISLVASPNLTNSSVSTIGLYESTTKLGDFSINSNGVYSFNYIAQSSGTKILYATLSTTAGETLNSNTISIPVGSNSIIALTTSKINFSVVGNKINAPNGNQWIAKGIKLSGVNGLSSRDLSQDVGLIKKIWGFDTVVLDCYLNSITGSQSANNNLITNIKTFTAKGIVTIISINDLPGGYVDVSSIPSLLNVINFFKDLATTFKDNPLVWFNPFSRPGGLDGLVNINWRDNHQEFIKAIRDDVGASNIIICSGSALGQELSNTTNSIVTGNSGILTYGSALKSFNNKAYDNIVFGLNIGNQWINNATLLTSYINLVEAIGPLIIMSYLNVDNSINLLPIISNVLQICKDKSIGIVASRWDGINENTLVTDVSKGGWSINKRNGNKPTNLSPFGQLVWDNT